MVQVCLTAHPSLPESFVTEAQNGDANGGLTEAFPLTAVPFLPNNSVKAFSVAPLTSKGLAQRMSGFPFKTPIVGPRSAQPLIGAVDTYPCTFE